ncbi:DoxX family protein [Streptomyces odontomachi]|uniref:DoxX family protein n=1 Tax=Streptomyces odontomachi TaxID=2944940 RepID=UPI00210D906D|nr:DoxX family protein [Streptomyces sp. ODS25]
MNQLDKYQSHVLGIFRVVVGLLFACHGASSLFGVLVTPHGGGSPSFGEWPSWWAAAIQFVGGILVLLGIGTRAAAMICSGSMAYAYFTKHQPHALFPIQNNGEPAAMFCWAFLLIMFFGPGSWALSSVVERLRGEQAVPEPAGRS